MTVRDLVLPRSRRTIALGWRREPERPWVLGHRGARHGAPENTLAAFDLALDEGADGVEIDVRLDRSERVVVLHDRTLERVTAGRDTRSVEALDAAGLAGVDVGGGERVPELERVLDWAVLRNARVNIELKRDVSRPGALVRHVAKIVRRRPEAPHSVVLSSFNPWMVAALSRLLPEIAVAWLVHEDQWALGRAPGHGLLGAAAIHPQASMVTAARIAPWQAAGLAVNVWTVNDVERAQELAALGVDGIITDTPATVLAALG